jgi:hypothetical protein
VNLARSRVAPPAWVRAEPHLPAKNHATVRALALACAGGGGQLRLLPCVVPAYAGARVLPLTQATRSQYVLATTVALAALCDVLVVCSTSPACASPSSSVCRRQRAPTNARPARLSAHARARVPTRLHLACLMRVWPRVYTPLALLREQERCVMGQTDERPGRT